MVLATLHTQLKPELSVFVSSQTGGAVDEDTVQLLVGAVDSNVLVFRPSDSMVFLGAPLFTCRRTHAATDPPDKHETKGFSTVEHAKLAVRLASRLKLASGSSLVCVLSGGDKTGGDAEPEDEAAMAKLAQLRAAAAKPKPPLLDDTATAQDRARFFRVFHGQVTPEMIAQYKKRVFDEVANLRRLHASSSSGRAREAELAPPAAAAAERAKAVSNSNAQPALPAAPPAAAPMASMAQAPREHGEVGAQDDDGDDDDDDDGTAAVGGLGMNPSKRPRKVLDAPNIFASAAAAAAAQALSVPARREMSSQQSPATATTAASTTTATPPAETSSAPVPAASASMRSEDDTNARFQNALAAIAENRVDWAAADKANAADVMSPWIAAQLCKVVGEADPDAVEFIKAQIRGHASKADVTQHVVEMLGGDAANDFVLALWKELKRVAAMPKT